MFDWMTDLYELLTARVPRPTSAMLFGLVTLSTFTLFLPFQPMLIELGFILPALCALLGYVAVVHAALPMQVEKHAGASKDHVVWSTIGLPFLVCIIVICAPSFEAVQRALSLAIGAYALCFILFAYVCQKAQTTDIARQATRNAANWNVARLVAMILGNEMLMRFGTPADWVMAVSLGPLVLHYLMHWTILATSPEPGMDGRTDP